jgi:acyl-CoA reductase-like NAD-dependent aldehyde dehydrogenase
MLRQLIVKSPYSGKEVARVGLASRDEISSMVVRGSSAQRDYYAQTTLGERVQLCRRFVDSMRSRGDEISREISLQMGKPIGEARNEINGMAARAEAMMDMADASLRDEEIRCDDDDDVPPVSRRIVHEPVGVVLCIAPWNYPLLTAVNCVVPAVLAGNAVVLKHSPVAPTVGDAFARAFREAGAPDALVQSLHCDGADVEVAIDQPEVGFVAFTGSVGVGREVYRRVAESRFIDVTLELGGKDAAYVAADADLERAVDSVLDGALYNAGQSCCSVERVYVDAARYDDFLDTARQKIAQQYRLGDPSDANSGANLGPLALESAPEFLSGQVRDAVARGARVLCGGKPTTDASGLGRFFEPTLVADFDHTMSIGIDESFGPLLAVASVADERQAIERINDSRYGLTAAVYTEDVERVERMAPHLQVGTVFQNACDAPHPRLPWTGVKDTGKGISLSRHGFRGVTRLKGYNFRK